MARQYVLFYVGNQLTQYQIKTNIVLWVGKSHSSWVNGKPMILSILQIIYR